MPQAKIRLRFLRNEFSDGNQSCRNTVSCEAMKRKCFCYQYEQIKINDAEFPFSTQQQIQTTSTDIYHFGLSFSKLV